MMNHLNKNENLIDKKSDHTYNLTKINNCSNKKIYIYIFNKYQINN